MYVIYVCYVFRLIIYVKHKKAFNISRYILYTIFYNTLYIIIIAHFKAYI